MKLLIRTKNKSESANDFITSNNKRWNAEKRKAIARNLKLIGSFEKDLAKLRKAVEQLKTVVDGLPADRDDPITAVKMQRMRQNIANLSDDLHKKLDEFASDIQFDT